MKPTLLSSQRFLEDLSCLSLMWTTWSMQSAVDKGNGSSENAIAWCWESGPKEWLFPCVESIFVNKCPKWDQGHGSVPQNHRTCSPPDGLGFATSNNNSESRDLLYLEGKSGATQYHSYLSIALNRQHNQGNLHKNVFNLGLMVPGS